MPNRHIMLVFGGESSEHEVSISSAHNVYAALDDESYDITLCYIDKSGKWWQVDSIDELTQESEIVAHLGEQMFEAAGQAFRPDVVLPILHGKGGEDGTIQGLCKILHIPIAGPSLLGAAVTMDKDLTKRLLRDAGVPVVDWICWQSHQQQPDYENVIAKLGSPIFVKPSNAGSSVGVSKVSDSDSFDKALQIAAEHDDRVIIESAISGREIELAVIGTHEPLVTSPGEIVPGQEFYSYDDKYDPNSTSQAHVPADLDVETAVELKRLALIAYRATAGAGMARVDFFVNGERIFLNEINSIPGFTNISMYPKLWRHEGISYPQLIDKLIEDALSR